MGHSHTQPTKTVNVNHSLPLSFFLPVPSCFKKVYAGKQHSQVNNRAGQRSCVAQGRYGQVMVGKGQGTLWQTCPPESSATAPLSGVAECHCCTTASLNISPLSACKTQKADSSFSLYHRNNQVKAILPSHHWRARVRVRAGGLPGRKASEHSQKHSEIKRQGELNTGRKVFLALLLSATD